jgi:hypothetical protein
MAIQYDPNLPIYPDSAKYTAPTLQNQTATLAPTKTADAYIDPDKATVGGQVNTLLKQDSPLIQSAQADAMQTANKRGLINSSMAATAGTKAAIDSVMPIAQQDAATYAGFGKTNQATENQGLLVNQVAEIDQSKMANNAALTGSLNEQNFTNQISAAGFAGGIQKQIAQMQITSAQKIALANIIGSQTNTLMSNIGSLLNNPDIEMGDNVTAWMSDYMYSGISGISSLFNMDIEVV